MRAKPNKALERDARKLAPLSFSLCVWRTNKDNEGKTMIIRPRLNDFHNLPFTQEEVDFAIPFLDEDIPL